MYNGPSLFGMRFTATLATPRGLFHRFTHRLVQDGGVEAMRSVE
jgi:hypothetical protein